MAASPDSATRALLGLRCPRCHQGQLFSYPALNLTKFARMPAQCPVCEQSFEPEPGFYFGSMYITFAFNVATLLVVGVLLYYLLNDPDTWVYLTAVTAALVLTVPFMFRYARVLMMHLFAGVSYERGLSEQPGQ